MRASFYPGNLQHKNEIEICSDNHNDILGGPSHKLLRMVIKNFLSQHQQALMRRLEMKGLGNSTIPCFIWSLKRCLLDNQDMNHLQANERLYFLGWAFMDMS